MSEYDALADDFSSIIESLPERRLFGYSLEVVEGEIAGQNVLDLACGNGVFTRALKKRGAKRVVGVDVSEAMLAYANRDEERDPLGIEYRLADVADMGDIGQFDLITAFALLHYAPSREALASMVQNIARNLRPGGRFTTCNMNVVDPTTWHNTSRWNDYPFGSVYPTGLCTTGHQCRR
ncbi:class I SAM-dependent methyltransferase [Lentzea sp. NPDC051213]|uniref:class I SAM-dependent methyltransferase n=1 Tax=Lentzea sp. NPDC051213 TaxID=3364126 RepID=UPI0037B04CCA